MTAPQEPLKLNPVEFANIAATITYEWTQEISTPELYSTMEFVAYVMKRTLALTARDDAAELRAALREWAEATRAAEWFELDQSNAYGTDHADAEDRVEAARRVLLALAATEGES